MSNKNLKYEQYVVNITNNTISFYTFVVVDLGSALLGPPFTCCLFPPFVKTGLRNISTVLFNCD